MLRKILLFSLTSLGLLAYETTNIQYLYSDRFKGDVFIYDTKDGKKSTITFEHFRTFSLGDFYMFVDAMEGEKFDGVKYDLYTEISPRLSLSKLSNTQLSLGILSDFYIAAQINMGSDYKAYLLGVGTDVKLSGFAFVSLNLYHKHTNLHEDTYQLSLAYSTKDFYNLHWEGFIDITGRDVNTQNQFLFKFYEQQESAESAYIGCEWLYYDYNFQGTTAHTDVLQAMVKYKF